MCVVPEDQDPRAVRLLLDGQVAAWNRGDLEGFMRGYWRSDSLSFYSGGTVTHGWQTTLDRYRRALPGRGPRDGHARLRHPRRDAAGARRGAWCAAAGASRFRESRSGGLFTLLLHWFPDEGWRVVHDHTSAAP